MRHAVTLLSVPRVTVHEIRHRFADDLQQALDQHPPQIDQTATAAALALAAAAVATGVWAGLLAALGIIVAATVHAEQRRWARLRTQLVAARRMLRTMSVHLPLRAQGQLGQELALLLCAQAHRLPAPGIDAALAVIAVQGTPAFQDRLLRSRRSLPCWAVEDDG